MRLNPLINDDNHNLSTTINDEQQQQQQNVDVIISSGDSSSNDDKQQQQLNPIAQFNDRRRDMFFEDYSVKQIQVVDTVFIYFVLFTEINFNDNFFSIWSDCKQYH